MGGRLVGPRAWAALRALLSLGMLGILLPRLHLSSLLPSGTAGALGWLAGALVAALAGVLAWALRWRVVVHALGLRARLPGLVSHCLAGLFVGNLLPSTIGGDALRVARLSATTRETSASFASVVLERLSGWVALPTLSLVAFALDPALFHGASGRIALLVALATAAGLAVVVVLAANPRLGGRLARRRGWQGFFGEVHLGLDRLARRPSSLVEMLVASFAYQLVVVLSVFLAGQAIGLRVGWTAMLAFTPVVAMVQVVPLTVGGLGLREGAFALFLAPLGVSTGRAVALGLLVYGTNLAVSLLGAPAFAVGARRARVAT